MVDSVLAALHIRLQQLSERELRRLDEENVPWLPRLGTLPLQVTTREILRALEASVTVSSCLQRVAWLYCWLMPRDMTGPWMVYRFGPSALHVDSLTILWALSYVLPSVGLPTTFDVRHFHGALYVCMIMRCGSHPFQRRYAVTFLVLWQEQRFVVAYAETSEVRLILAHALHVALYGAGVELPNRMYADVNSAFNAAHTDLDGPTVLRLEGDPSIAARFLFTPNSDPQEQALDLSSVRREQGQGR
ncbi:uncharacterized protein LOC119401972 isoform X2 [Rhipicephalus sanguineus]|uniref:uncharacterized protein LOC119401972 isoform X2 n=1 Tax=Rhipicephalus sanguineus TaxID=34632 RepID=UPI0020C54B34|nr:uncharacterized protein LOC119401972 isoform X2 [Rhipicephalus sanguineus]